MITKTQHMNLIDAIEAEIIWSLQHPERAIIPENEAHKDWLAARSDRATRQKISALRRKYGMPEL